MKFEEKKNLETLSSNNIDNQDIDSQEEDNKNKSLDDSKDNFIEAEKQEYKTISDLAENGFVFSKIKK